MAGGVHPPVRAAEALSLARASLAAFVAGLAVAGDMAAQPATSELRFRALDSAVAAAARDGFSGVVLIAQGTDILFERAYGRAAMLPAPAGDVAFWLASDSKQFTATAVVRLQEMGQLSVRDSIGRFLPGVPPDKRGITLQQLLTQRACQIFHLSLGA